MPDILLVSRVESQRIIENCLAKATRVVNQAPLWRHIAVDSLPKAVRTVSTRNIEVVLWEVLLTADGGAQHLPNFLTVAPHIPFAALLTHRKFEPEEFEVMMQKGINAFFDRDLITEPYRFVNALNRLASQSPFMRVHNLLRTQLGREFLPAAALCLDAIRTVGLSDDGGNGQLHSRILPTLRSSLPRDSRSRTETFLNCCKLLLLVELVSDGGHPVSQVNHRAGFHSANAARQMLTEYTGEQFSRLGEAGTRTRAQERLIALLSGRTATERVRLRTERRATSDERRATSDERRATSDEGRGTRDEGRGTRDEGRGTRDEGRRVISIDALGKYSVPNLALLASRAFFDLGRG